MTAYFCTSFSVRGDELYINEGNKRLGKDLIFSCPGDFSGALVGTRLGSLGIKVAAALRDSLDSVSG